MKTKLRFCLLFLFFFTTIFVIYKNSTRIPVSTEQNLTPLNFQLPHAITLKRPGATSLIVKFNQNYDKCTFKQGCFNITKCYSNAFKVYIYKRPTIVYTRIYQDILDSIRYSPYYTNNPMNACMFLLSIDTLDRDRLSSNYVRDINSLVKGLKLWNNGTNHVIFNLYSGTWPDYVDTLNFDFGKAILLQASLSNVNYRQDYDVSFPLFPSNIGESQDNGLLVTSDNETKLEKRKYFLTFKGKRYLSGIGSKARNALFHLNNGRDVFLLTTCNHTSNFQVKRDDRCDADDISYTKFDYDDLLYNSTFCLIPRGRRLATYRFLESLKAGCIPVILSNGWILPFSEVLNWELAVIWVDEDFTAQIPSLLRDIPIDMRREMQRHTLMFYYQYFVSIRRIVHTSLEIIYERVFPTKARPSLIWNKEPGAVYFDHAFSSDVCSYPFPSWRARCPTTAKCTLVVICDSQTNAFRPETIQRLKFIEKIITVNCKIQDLKLKNYTVKKNLVNLWYRLLKSEFNNDCVINVNSKHLNDALINHAFNEWNLQQHLIVGANTYNVHWNGTCRVLSKSSGKLNTCMINSDFFIIHKYYIHRLLRSHSLYKTCQNAGLSNPQTLLKDCIAITLNLLINKITRQRPAIRTSFSELEPTTAIPTKPICIDSLYSYIESTY